MNNETKFIHKNYKKQKKLKPFNVSPLLKL